MNQWGGLPIQYSYTDLLSLNSPHRPPLLATLHLSLISIQLSIGAAHKVGPTSPDIASHGLLFGKPLWFDASSHHMATGPPAFHDRSIVFGKPLWFDAALVNKLVPCAWFLSGTLEIYSLGLRLRLFIIHCIKRILWVSFMQVVLYSAGLSRPGQFYVFKIFRFLSLMPTQSRT